MISVIIPTYCYQEITEERLLLTLAGYLKQTLSQTQYEILVIDDGTEDYNIKASIEKYFKDISQIRYIKKRHAGFCSAINYGVEQAKGEYILMGIDDNIPSSTALEELLSSIMNLGENYIGVMGQESWLENITWIKNLFTGEQFKGTKKIENSSLLKVFPTITINDIYERYDELLKYCKIPKNYQEMAELLSGNSIAEEWLCVRPGALLIKKDKYFEIGGLDDRFDPSGWYSDIELGYRLTKLNYHIASTDKAMFIHLSHCKFYSDQDEQTCYHYLLSKHPDPILALLPFLWKMSISSFVKLAHQTVKNLDIIHKYKHN